MNTTATATAIPRNFMDKDASNGEKAESFLRFLNGGAEPNFTWQEVEGFLGDFLYRFGGVDKAERNIIEVAYLDKGTAKTRRAVDVIFQYEIGYRSNPVPFQRAVCFFESVLDGCDMSPYNENAPLRTFFEAETFEDELAAFRTPEALDFLDHGDDNLHALDWLCSACSDNDDF